MLQANQIDVAEIQELGGLTIGSQVVLGEFKANARGIIVAFFGIVDGQGKQFGGSVFRVNCVAEVGGERGDPTFTGQIISDDSDSGGKNWPRMDWPKRSQFFFQHRWINFDHFLHSKSICRLGIILGAEQS